MTTLDHCVYLLLEARIEKERVRCRAKEKRRRENNPDKVLQLRREWAKKNPEKVAASNKKHYAANREQVGTAKKRYYAANREKCISIAKDWQKTNPEKVAACQKSYKKAHPEKMAAISKKYYSANRLLCALRGRLRSALRGADKAARTVSLLGCTVEQLRARLEKQFRPGMTWENYGPVWEVDHIRPCASFDFAQPEQQRQCFHFSNLQPLFAEENRRKADKWLI